MFPGANLSDEAAEKLFLRFECFTDYFQQGVREGGIYYLLAKYQKLVCWIEQVDRWMRRVQSHSPLRHKDMDITFIMALEYWHVIGCRYALEIIAEHLEGCDLSKLRILLAPLDERLRNLLGEVSPDWEYHHPLNGQREEDYWFVRAIPRCADWSIDDEEDLRSKH